MTNAIPQLKEYGWDEDVQRQWEKIQTVDTIPGRVIADFGGSLTVVTPKKYTASVAGNLKKEKTDFLPKVGDWVSLRPDDDEIGVIRAVFARKNSLDRKAPGGRIEKQVLAANIDVAFIVQSLNDNFNPMRLDRYAFQLAESNIRPIFVFNKQDIADEINEKKVQIQSWGRDVVFTDALSGSGVEKLMNFISEHETAVFIGSSGVGKSTLTNRILGEDRQKTAEVRSDDRGRHTTSHRELFIAPNGGIIVDTPGIRELQLWGEEGSLEAVFPDIVELAQHCRFRNCHHTVKEKGCAVQQAIKKRELTAERFESYTKLRDELASGRPAWDS